MRRSLLSFLFLILIKPSYAFDNTQLTVWVNEAIVATYTYSYQNFIERQQAIAHYFTSTGWINYSNALNASGLPNTVKTNNYSVSAVATMPPEVKERGPNQWQATMPLLVVYKNAQSQQKQTLQVTITFEAAPRGQGVRGLAISSLQAVVSDPPCVCATVSNAQAK